MNDLAEQVVLITGAGRGLGRVMALTCAAAGASVVLSGRQTGDLEAVAAEIGTAGPKVAVVPADLRVAEQITYLAEQAVAQFGRVDVLVNNAGIGIIGPSGQVTSLLDIGLADWDDLFATNLRAPFLLIKALLPRMLARHSGVIVNITSNLTNAPRPGIEAYGGSKAALDYLTRCVGAEVAGSGVVVYGLHPGGVVDTAFFRARLPAALRARALQPEVIGPPLMYLAVERPVDLVGQVVDSRVFHEQHGLAVPWLFPPG